MRMNVVNLTPHTLNIKVVSDYKEHGIMNGISGSGMLGINYPIWLELEPSGQVARVSSSSELVGEVAGIPVFETVYGDIEGLPDPKDGTIYVVSGMTQAQTSRQDVYAPGDLIRDENGKPIGCRGLKANTSQKDPDSLSFTLSFTEAYDAKDAVSELTAKGFTVTHDNPGMASPVLKFTKTNTKLSIAEIAQLVMNVDHDATNSYGYGSAFVNRIRNRNRGAEGNNQYEEIEKYIDENWEKLTTMTRGKSEE